ncbi:hypothetical protein DCE79_13680 [Lysinibacillus sp. 2017]|nr:hypothetical protein DCE79_13680 [Lysinibacillus sp. 2017]
MDLRNTEVVAMKRLQAELVYTRAMESLKTVYIALYVFLMMQEGLLEERISQIERGLVFVREGEKVNQVGNFRCEKFLERHRRLVETPEGRFYHEYKSEI